MTNFIRENAVFVASAGLLAVLIAGASALAQKGSLDYVAPTSANTTTRSTADHTASAPAATTVTAGAAQQSAPVKTTVVPAKTTPAPASSPTVQPSVRHRRDDEGGYDN